MISIKSLSVFLASIVLFGCIAETKENSDLDKDGVADTEDCAPQNKLLWQMKSYSSVDADQDKKFIAKSGSICSGDSLPKNYLAEIVKDKSLIDCDDSSSEIWRLMKAYRDIDKDGYGTGEQLDICSGKELPAGFALTNTDCDDKDSAKWSSRPYQSQDMDSDGKFTTATGQVCTGEILPVNFSAEAPAGEIDCDDNNPNIFSLHSYKAEDKDADGRYVPNSGDLCTGKALPQRFLPVLPPGEFDCDDNDSTIFSRLSYKAKDKDFDGKYIPTSGELCAGNTLPKGFLTDLPSGEIDCNDDNSGIWKNARLYKDSDKDSYGTGSVTLHCIGNNKPEQWAENPGDCDDNDPAIFSLLPYKAKDKDSDDKYVAASGELCTAGALPKGFLSGLPAGKIDCNDDNSATWQSIQLYKDQDNDTYGAGNEVEHCIGNKKPEQWVENSKDCDDSNKTIWRIENIYSDTDNDGFGNKNTEQQACIGLASPAGQVLNSTDCNDNDSGKWRIDYAYFDLDGDGIGVGEKRAHCTGHTPLKNTSSLNYDCDDNNSSIFRRVTVYTDIDRDGIGSGTGAIVCMGNSYLEEGVSIYGYDPEPNNTNVSGFDLPVFIRNTH